MKKKAKREPTTLIRVWVRAHRAAKVEAAQKGRKLTELASEKLLAPSSPA